MKHLTKHLFFTVLCIATALIISGCGSSTGSSGDGDSVATDQTPSANSSDSKYIDIENVAMTTTPDNSIKVEWTIDFKKKAYDKQFSNIYVYVIEKDKIDESDFFEGLIDPSVGYSPYTYDLINTHLPTKISGSIKFTSYKSDEHTLYSETQDKYSTGNLIFMEAYDRCFLTPETVKCYLLVIAEIMTVNPKTYEIEKSDHAYKIIEMKDFMKIVK